MRNKQTSEEVLSGHVNQSFDMDGWHGKEVSSDTTVMKDDGKGKPMILRNFEFAINPETQRELEKKGITPTKQDLFNAHWPQIRVLLWGDGLVPNELVDPRIVIEKDKYRIFILCEPKNSAIVNNKLKTLQEVFNGNA